MKVAAKEGRTIEVGVTVRVAAHADSNNKSFRDQQPGRLDLHFVADCSTMCSMCCRDL